MEERQIRAELIEVYKMVHGLLGHFREIIETKLMDMFGN